MSKLKSLKPILSIFVFMFIAQMNANEPQKNGTISLYHHCVRAIVRHDIERNRLPELINEQIDEHIDDVRKKEVVPFVALPEPKLNPCDMRPEDPVWNKLKMLEEIRTKDRFTYKSSTYTICCNHIYIWHPHKSGFRILKGHREYIRTFIFDCERGMLYTGSSDGCIGVWSIIDNTLITMLEGHNSSVCCLLLDDQRKRLYSGSGDTQIGVWNTEQNKLITMLKREGTIFRPNHTIARLALDQNNRLYAGEGNKVAIWDPVNCRLIALLSTPRTNRFNYMLYIRHMVLDNDFLYTNAEKKQTLNRWQIKHTELLSQRGIAILAQLIQQERAKRREIGQNADGQFHDELQQKLIKQTSAIINGINNGQSQQEGPTACSSS